MVPQLARVAESYGIPVMSSSGFESTTDKYRFAEELAGHDRPTEVLHIGDHDPSGAHMFLAFLRKWKRSHAILGRGDLYTPCRDTRTD